MVIAVPSFSANDSWASKTRDFFSASKLIGSCPFSPNWILWRWFSAKDAISLWFYTGTRYNARVRWRDCVIGIISGFFAFTTTSRIIINNITQCTCCYTRKMDERMKRENSLHTFLQELRNNQAIWDVQQVWGLSSSLKHSNYVRQKIKVKAMITVFHEKSQFFAKNFSVILFWWFIGIFWCSSRHFDLHLCVLSSLKLSHITEKSI